MWRRVRRTHRAGGWIAAAVIATFALTPTAASPLARSLGDLTPIGCVRNIGSGSIPDGPSSCDLASDGLGAATQVAVSPDGKSVYVTGKLSNAIGVFARDTATGKLSPAGCIGQTRAGPASCNSADGLVHPAGGLAVSPDGTSVYLTGFFSSSVVAFRRDTGTGGLTPAGCLANSRSGLASASCNTTEGLIGAWGLVVSPDGKNVYVAATESAAVVVFRRDTATGNLSAAGCLASGSDPSASGCNTAVGLSVANGVAVSPDGKNVYVTGHASNAVVAFARDPATGNLTSLECVGNTGNGPSGCVKHTNGLDGPKGVAVTPDGKNLYVTSDAGNAVVVLGRDTGTGALTASGCIANSGSSACDKTAAGLQGAQGVTVSPDGKNVYVTAGGSNAVVAFARDTSNGSLTPAGCIGQSGNHPAACANTDGLLGAYDVAASPDGKNVYVTGGGSSAVVEFARDTTSAPAPPAAPPPPAAPSPPSPPPPPGSPPPPPPPPSTSGAPVISQAHLAPARFKAAKRGGSTSVSPGTGSTLSYVDSQPATTTIGVLRPTAGHLNAGKCLAGAPRNGQKRCTRNVALGSFLHDDTAGLDKAHFSGRIARHTLAPGSYLLALTPRANGRTGTTVRLGFRISR